MNQTANVMLAGMPRTPRRPSMKMNVMTLALCRIVLARAIMPVGLRCATGVRLRRSAPAIKTPLLYEQKKATYMGGLLYFYRILFFEVLSHQIRMVFLEPAPGNFLGDRPDALAGIAVAVTSWS